MMQQTRQQTGLVGLQHSSRQEQQLGRRLALHLSWQQRLMLPQQQQQPGNVLWIWPSPLHQASSSVQDACATRVTKQQHLLLVFLPVLLLQQGKQQQQP
jgi:hypothetical protein